VELAQTQAALAGQPELRFAVIKRTTGGELPEQLSANFTACMTQLLAALAVE
jgi:hypothetical protein